MRARSPAILPSWSEAQPVRCGLAPRCILHQGQEKKANTEHFQGFLDEVNQGVREVAIAGDIGPIAQDEFHAECPGHIDGTGLHPANVQLSAMQACGYPGNTLGDISGRVDALFG